MRLCVILAEISIIVLNLPLFIANKTSKPNQGTFSSTIYKVAVISISLGLAVMILSFLIMLGFQNTIKKKVYDFTGHLQVSQYMAGNSYAERPSSLWLDSLENKEGISHIQAYAYKYGLLQNDEGVEGIVYKGVGVDFDSTEFNDYILEGRFLHLDTTSISLEVVISKREAERMNLKVGGSIIMHFIQEPPRTRRLQVVGIYETGMEDFDDKLMLGDIALVRRLNNWTNDQAGGYEVFVSNTDKIEEVYRSLYDQVGYDLYVQKSSLKYIQIFEWLSLINNNVNILIFMVLLVASFNMISIILILILERTPMIGTLKALGASDHFIRQIFIYNGIKLVVRGLLIGDLIGIGLAAIQAKFQVFPLDPNNYYMSYVPIEFNWLVIIGLNLLIFIIVSLVLFIPTLFISRIEPIKAIRFD